MSKKKQENLYRFVGAKIICGGYGVGERLPSLRRLAEQFHVSLPTARRTMEHLAKLGLVELRHGSGCYVAEHRQTERGRRISVVSVPFSEGPDRNLTGIAVAGVKHRIQELGLKMQHHFFLASEFNDCVLDSISRKSSGIILLGGYDSVLEHPKPRTPMVGLVMHNTYGGIFSVIDLDPVRSAELAAEFFRSRNKKRIFLIISDRQNYAFRELVFRSLWNLPGETCTEISAPVTEFDPSCGYLYVFGANAYHDALNYHRLRGRILAEDYTVLCMDGRPMFHYSHPTAMPTIALNWRQAGIAAVDELYRRLSSPDDTARRIYINTKLHLEEPAEENTENAGKNIPLKSTPYIPQETNHETIPNR